MRKCDWNFYVFFLILYINDFHGFTAETSMDSNDCSFRQNITDMKKISIDRLEVLEDCVFHYLTQREARLSALEGIKSLESTPPPEYPLKISIDRYDVLQIDLLQKASAEFNIHGDLYLSWNDSRLMWNDTDWKIDTFELHDGQQVWTPTFSDESDCGLSEGCISKVSDVALNSDGKVTARLTFRYPSFCHINFYRYPEETNDCKLFLILSNTEHPIKYDIQTRERAYLFKPVIISKLDNEKGSTILTNVETSVWTVEDRTVEIVKIGEFKSDYIKLSVHAKKEMSTLKIALSLPVTIATMLMLVSPLFGDLKTQAFVKLLTLTLQTMSFLFLCSIAPPNGFGGSKPKLYTFYEFLFFLTFVSILVTLVCLALCRVKRSVPASHSLYLTAKVINHFLCCIEPDPATSYQRHFEVDNTPFDTISNNGGAVGRCSSAANHDVNSNDYSLEWKHIYIAANNLFSGISFSIFCFVIIFGIL